MLIVELLKNRQYPLEIPENVAVKHNDMVIVLTQKGEEAAKAIQVPPQVASILTKKKVPTVPFIRVMTEEDLEYYKELYELD